MISLLHHCSFLKQGYFWQQGIWNPDLLQSSKSPRAYMIALMITWEFVQWPQFIYKHACCKFIYLGAKLIPITSALLQRSNPAMSAHLIGWAECITSSDWLPQHDPSVQCAGELIHFLPAWLLGDPRQLYLMNISGYNNLIVMLPNTSFIQENGLPDASLFKWCNDENRYFKTNMVSCLYSC